MPSLPARFAPAEERIGIVTHYYNHLSVAIMRLESGTLRVGDMIHIRGHTTDFTQGVESLEVDHAQSSRQTKRLSHQAHSQSLSHRRGWRARAVDRRLKTVSKLSFKSAINLLAARAFWSTGYAASTWRKVT